MPPVGKRLCGKYGHVCHSLSLADLHRRALLLSPSRITTAAPLALSRLPSAPGAATLFSLPVFFSTLVPPSVDDSPSHNTNRKFARPPPDLLHFHSRIHFPLSLPSLSHNLLFLFLFQILFSCFRTLHSVRPLVILRPYYSVSFLCYSTPELRYCRDS